jgi:hypothetical protein
MLVNASPVTHQCTHLIQRRPPLLDLTVLNVIVMLAMRMRMTIMVVYHVWLENTKRPQAKITHTYHAMIAAQEST